MCSCYHVNAKKKVKDFLSEVVLPELTCRFCGHSWKPRTEIPFKCPGCGKILKKEAKA